MGDWTGLFGHNLWYAAFVLFMALLLGIGSRYFLVYFRDSSLSNEWTRKLCDVLYPSVFWVLGIYSFLFVLEPFFEEKANFALSSRSVSQARHIFLVVVFGFLLIRWKKSCVQVLLLRHTKQTTQKVDQLFIFALDRLATVILVALCVVFSLEVLGVPLSLFLAFGGVGGLAISWAAKDVIANFFGGLMIYVNRPFTVGDWIKANNKSFEGIVESVGWYMTKIRSFERRPTYIPNAIFLDAIIENPGRMYNRRIKQTIGLRYEDIDRVQTITQDIEAMLRSHPGIDEKQTLLVDFLAFGPFSLDIQLYAFTKTTVWKEYRRVQQDVFLRIAQIVESHQAQIAFPTQTVHVSK